MATQNMVSAPERSNSFATPANGTGPTGSSAIKGFGGSTPHSSTVASSAGKAPASKGTSVQGFSGNGLLAGKV